MAYFVIKIGTACSEKPQKAYSLGSPISGIVVVVCSGIKKYGGEKSKFYEIDKKGRPAKSSAEVVNTNAVSVTGSPSFSSSLSPLYTYPKYSI